MPLSIKTFEGFFVLDGDLKLFAKLSAEPERVCHPEDYVSPVSSACLLYKKLEIGLQLREYLVAEAPTRHLKLSVERLR